MSWFDYNICAVFLTDFIAENLLKIDFCAKYDWMVVFLIYLDYNIIVPK